MLILLDVGNTAITYGLYQGGRLQASGSFMKNDIPKIVKKWSKNGALNKSKALISSVVPEITSILKKSIAKKGAKVWVLGQNLPISIKNRYASIKKLGMDRIVNIYGALRMYKPPFVILDLGTAIKADFVSRKGVFEGGMIIPGAELAFQALIQKAALLPKKLRLPSKSKSFLGRSTYDCMATGILEGYGSMLDGLVARFKRHLGKEIRVIATGGFAKTLRPYTHSFDILDTQHSLKSLLIIFKDKLSS